MCDPASSSPPSWASSGPPRDAAEIEKNRLANRLGHPRVEQGRPEAKIRSSELAYRRLFEAARDGILILDLDTGRISDVNPFLIELLGYPRSEMLGKTVAELSPFQDLMPNQVMLERLQQDGYIRYEELPLATMDGRRIDVEFVSNVYAVGEKEVIQCNIRDISARKREASARAQLAAIVESSTDAIISVDIEGLVTSWNAAAESTFGYTAQEMIGTSVMRLIPPDRHAEEEEVLLRIASGVRLRHFETMRLTREGRPIYVSITISPIKDALGQIVGASKIVQDISERKAAEEALRKSEARYQRIAANVPGMVYQFLLRPDGSYTFPFVSEGCREICGLSPQQLQHDGRLAINLIDSADRSGAEQSIRASAHTLQPWLWEGRIVRADLDKIICVQAAARPEHQENGDVIWDGVAMDVTERKRAEEDRLAKVAAERANLAKSDFLSRMSHELRTPLNAILGFGQLLEMRDMTEKQRESVEHIVVGGRQLLELVNELLDIARIESGRMVMELEAVAIQDLVHETLSLVGPIAAEREVALHVREGIGPPTGMASGPYVTADRQRLRQVLLNLLSNAVKFNVPGGHVTVTYAISAGGLRLRVTDTGRGIPADKQRRLFTPFDRLDAETGNIVGTGLGLALSKRLMEAMGGNLGLEEASVLNTQGDTPAGAVFWLELPIATGAPAAEPESPESLVPSSSGGSLPSGSTLLYIEDNLSNLRLIESLMDGYPEVRLLTALQGTLGLELAKAERPDLILLDVHLPDVPGWNVLAQLRANEGTRDIPVVIVSADATESQIKRLREAGACEYLTKPLDLRKFLSVLREQLGKRRPKIPNG